MRGDALTAEKLARGRASRDAYLAAKRERAHIFASRAQLRLTPSSADAAKRSKGGLRRRKPKTRTLKANGEEESKEERIEVGAGRDAAPATTLRVSLLLRVDLARIRIRSHSHSRPTAPRAAPLAPFSDSVSAPTSSGSRASSGSRWPRRSATSGTRTTPRTR